jgi:alkanesulfonate monooxygenase SsuD/methylene tetrahydromethanopterin reductase-like flavin-dependent oxidoreductase (luciferase family)
MRYAYCINAGDDFNAVIDLACEAEQAGWDGFFVPDGIAIDVPNMAPFPLFDPWVLLGAIAARTSRIRVGTMITPVSRRRPWKLARECATADHLSKGRLILSVGLGAATDDAGFYKVGEAMDLRVRAERLDEGLAIIDGLWKGTALTFAGKHFRLEGMTMIPSPVQKPRIPIWVVAVWQKPKSLRRMLSWDGVIPQK